MNNIINLFQRKTIFVTKSMRIQTKEIVGKRKTGVLKRMLIRDPVDLYFVLSNIKQNFSSFKTPLPGEPHQLFIKKLLLQRC